jgi:hypothetical protein
LPSGSPEDFSAHKAILQIAAILLGPTATGLAVIKTTLDALKSLSSGDWITIFNRESEGSRAGRFQITLAEPDAAQGFLVALMAFELNATAEVTQVLFFKSRSNAVTLRHMSGRISVNTKVLDRVRSIIADKVAGHVAENVAALPI